MSQHFDKFQNGVVERECYGTANEQVVLSFKTFSSSKSLSFLRNELILEALYQHGQAKGFGQHLKIKGLNSSPTASYHPSFHLSK